MTSAGAGVALTSPWWLPTLKAASSVAADVLPILGALWLIVQIVTRLTDTFRKKADG